MNLENKVIVVTGGQGLLGSVIIDNLRKHGAIAISADISVESNMDENKLFIDITNKESIKGSIKLLTDKYGRIDGWVNNAYPRTKDWGNKFEDIEYSSWQKNVDMHLNGYFLCCQLVLEEMKKRKQGCLINMSSIYGSVGPDFSVYDNTSMTMPAAYSAIKGGLVNLSRYLAAYYGPDNLRINTVSPGGIFDNQPKSFVNRYEEKVPMRRMGQPIDIAPSVSFLLSDSASYISGHDLIIDGGWTAI